MRCLHAGLAVILLALGFVAGAVPSLESMGTAFIPIEVCYTGPGQPATAAAAPPCPGYDRPQLAPARVRGDNATLCYHLGCCYVTSPVTAAEFENACVQTTAPSGEAAVAVTAAGGEVFSGNQPVPALSNTRGNVQIPLETADALAVDCIYFPPMFGTCDGSRSDSRDDRPSRQPWLPAGAPATFGGATQNLTLNGAPLVATAFRWSPWEIVRTAATSAAASGGGALAATSSVRMPLGQAQVLLLLEVRNNGTAPQPARLSLETPFVSRMYSEVEAGYEGNSPKPLTNSRNASDWTFSREGGGDGGGAAVPLQTARDTGGGLSLDSACATVAFAGSRSGGGGDGGFADVTLAKAAGGAWSHASAGTAALAPGQALRLGVVLTVSTSCTKGAAAARRVAGAFGAAWAAVPAQHESRWRSAFDPADASAFDGHFPTLDVDQTNNATLAALARTYYGSLMSMMLVNKQGLDYDYEGVSAPPPSPALATSTCGGTYLPLGESGGASAGAPLQLEAGTLVAHQFLGHAGSYAWRSGAGTLSANGTSIEMAFDNGAMGRGAIASPDCKIINWTMTTPTANATAAGATGSAAAPPGMASAWVRVRPPGRWNLFVAAGALLGETAFYLWDTSGASLLWALLDPRGLSVANDVFGTADPLLKNACDYVALKESGKYYAFSAVSAFQALANELRVGGRAAALRRNGLTNRTLVEQLVATANEYRRLPTFGGTALPDWGGGASAFLECQATYQHGVAALQAGQVWMLREAAAAVRSVGGDVAQAADMEARAKTLLQQLLPQLQMNASDGANGWWHMLYPGSAANASAAPPTRVEGRFIHDFLYTGQTIAPDLAPAQRAAMRQFFARELRTPGFARAMSQRDPSAADTSSRRTDHDQWGSWDGWVGGSITALVYLGGAEQALQLALDLAPLLDQGPFGQAHRVFGAGEGRGAAMARGARKDQSWMAVCGGYIADGVLRGLFGFDPSIIGAASAPASGVPASPALRLANSSRGFSGTLRHVRYRGALFTITSGANGLSVALES